MKYRVVLKEEYNAIGELIKRYYQVEQRGLQTLFMWEPAKMSVDAKYNPRCRSEFYNDICGNGLPMMGIPSPSDIRIAQSQSVEFILKVLEVISDKGVYYKGRLITKVLSNDEVYYIIQSSPVPISEYVFTYNDSGWATPVYHYPCSQDIDELKDAIDSRIELKEHRDKTRKTKQTKYIKTKVIA